MYDVTPLIILLGNVLEPIVERAVKKALDGQKSTPTDPERWYNLNELCEYLPDRPAAATVYGWVHNAIIPHHKSGKKLRFLKSEIDLWLKQGKKKTVSEIEAEAKNYIDGLKNKQSK